MDISGFKTELAALGTRLDDRAAYFPHGAAVAFEWPPEADVTDPRVAVAARMVRGLAQMHSAVKAIEDDPRFSEQHKARLIAEARENGRNAVSAELATAEALVAKFDQADAQQAVPPALAPTDYNGGLIDAEIRTHVRGLTNAQHAQLAQTILDGKAPRMLEALLRSPIPIAPALAAVVAPAWVDEIARRDPQSAKLRATAKAVNESLRITATHARGALPSAPNAAHASLDTAARAAAGRLNRAA